MSLVTRCPACGTAFRVQRNQLAVRAGAVRCGKCGDVFDGVAGLVDEAADRLWVEPSPQLGLFDPSRKPPPAATAPAADEPLPTFLVEEPEPSRWRAWLWFFLCAAALAALGAQVYRVRTELTALVPQLRPALEAACRFGGCTVPLPRRPELIRIVSDDMHDDRDRQVYVLNALLRNVAGFPQPYPDLELTLTEAGKPITRRVLRPAEYAGARASTGFEAGAEEPLRVYIDARSVRASGYELCIFPHDCVKKPTR